MTEPPKIFAIVSRHDYPRLRRLIPTLPEDFCCWIERRYHERQAYEASCRRYAEIEAVCPVAFEHDCRDRTPLTEVELDAWAARTHHAPMTPAAPERRVEISTRT
ncbi:MAG TPA: hypothetical protein VH414_12240 [Lichenihabitans sp.]|nr:hypothetical protein [Lichenihabitans sp.]